VNDTYKSQLGHFYELKIKLLQNKNTLCQLPACK